MNWSYLDLMCLSCGHSYGIMSSGIAFAQRYNVWYGKVEDEGDKYEDDHFG